MSGGNCPETPRQKMIGMMYLMLTAMLALNVSGDLLNAFDLVDKSIRNQTKSTDEKLAISYVNFEAKKDQNPDKVQAKYDLAMDVKSKADSLVNLIQGYKQEIINRVDGVGSGSTPENYLNKSDQDNPATVMIVEQGGARSATLKKALNDYRDQMIAYALMDSTLKDTTLAHAIASMINTDDSRSATDNSIITWESQNFEHLPVAACMGLLSAMQSNVRNVETDMVNYLYKAIDAASFKFNTLVPLVIPESQYVIQGGQYKADIMLAAYDDTMEPIVSVGGQKLPVENGKGKYVASASAVGMRTYSAVLEIPDPVTGVLKPYNVEAKYEVGAPSLVVSATKMNSMYRGLPNPIEVSVAGMSPSDLNVTCTGGSMTREGNGYVVKPSQAKEIIISVTSNAGGHSQNFGSKSFRVFDVPDPVVTFVGAKNGSITKNAAVKGEVIAELKDFVFDVAFKIESFSVSTIKNGFLTDAKNTGSGKLNSQQVNLINGISRNGKLFVEGVRASGPDGKVRNLNGVSLTIN